VRQVQVEGVDGLGYIETLADWEQRQQQGNWRSPARPTASTSNTPNAEHRRPALEPAHHPDQQRLTQR
jgi:hypothetical protein